MSEVLYEFRDGIARVTLNRPDKLNSFHAAMHGELRQAIGRTRDDGARALILTGAGRAFCTGQDLAERVAPPGAPLPDLGHSIETNYKPLVLALRALPLPVIAAVNGAAAGAGANLAFACDIVLAATGDRLPAEQAESWGLIWKCVDDDRLMPEAEALAARFAQGPPLGYAAIKRTLYASPANTLEQQLDLERDTQRELGRSEDYREGVAAFMEKRPPAFTGK